MTTEPVRVDASRIAALHHPLRRRLVELMSLNGPATASQLAQHTDQHVGNVSHHLKMLHKAGLIEAAPELARDKRERWWRHVPLAMSWSVADMTSSADHMIAEAAEQENLTHHVEKVRQWFDRRDSYATDWVRAAYSTDKWLQLTPDELDELGRRLVEVVREFAEEVRTDDGRVREPVFIFSYAVPAQP